MALTAVRDLEAVVDGVGRWLADRRDAEVVVRSSSRPTEGWSSETVLATYAVDGRDEAVAVRLPPLGEGIFPTYDLRLQATAQQVAADAGVPAAVPAEVVDDPAWLGEPFLVMPLVEGHVPGELAALDPWFEGRGGAYEAVLDALARLHRHGPDDRLPHRTVGDELARWRRYLDWYAEPGEAVALLAEALDWCAEHRPATEPPAAVLWGDVRLGNVVFADGGEVRALLDWEMASVGAPEHDLGWWWALEALQDELLGFRAEPFPSIAAARARYEAAAGRGLRDLDWYQTFALVRSTTVLTRIGILQRRAGAPTRLPLDDNPVLDVLVARLRP